MLKHYDQTKAVVLILSRMNPADYVELPWDSIPQLLAQCVEADFDYMLSCDIMHEDGSDGECYYNKRRAFMHIARALMEKNSFSDARLQEIAALIDDYMDYNRSYLQLNGLKYHEDERLQEDC